MKLNLSVLVFALLAALMLNTAAMAADDAEYQAALAKAQETLSDAEGKVQLWSTSEILLNDAEKAAVAGDFELAVKLATEARLQGELAVATAEREKSTWQNHVPK
jgi:hypothetical protein